jgi:Bacterial pre-peptidase C-terminal domain
MSKYRFFGWKGFLGASAILVVATAGAPRAAATCGSATQVTLNTTYRASGSAPLKVTLGGPGVLTLYVSTAGGSPEPKMTFLGTDCVSPSGEGSVFDYVEHTPGWLTVEVYSSDTLFFNVAPKNPLQTLGDFKLRASWVSAPSTPDEDNTLTSDATGSCSSSSTPLSAYAFDENRFVTTHENIDQWDDDIMRLASTAPGVVIADIIDPTSQSVTAALYEDDACSAGAKLAQADLTPSSGRLAAVVHAPHHLLALTAYDGADGAYEVAVQLYTFCDLGETDDHADDPLCATAIDLDGHDDGDIDDGGSNDDDEDFFTFVLTAGTTVDIESSGDLDTFGSLYDESGALLETDDDDGTGDNFFIERTLAAGRYYVRVEGVDGAEDSYGLEVTTAP